MDPTLVPGTRFESRFQICVYEHAILRIYISFFPTIGIRAWFSRRSWVRTLSLRISPFIDLKKSIMDSNSPRARVWGRMHVREGVEA